MTKARRVWFGRRAPLAATLALLAAFGGRASADEAADARAAIARFKAAKRLEAAHDYDRACPEFERVTHMIPGKLAPQMALAECYEAAGKLKSASDAYAIAARTAATANDSRADDARDKVVELAGRIPKLRIIVPASVRALPGLTVDRDDVRVGPGEWGVDVPVDPGRHVIAVAIRRTPARKRLVVLEAKNSVTSFEVPAPTGDLARVAAEQAVAPRDVPSGPSGPIWPLATGIAGAALLGVGVGFGIDALVAKGHLAGQCFADHTCPAGYDPTAENARKDRGFAIFMGAGIAGLAAIAIGTVGAITAPKPPAKTPAAKTSLGISPFVGNGGLGILVKGATW